jgi:hypothetical protein
MADETGLDEVPSGWFARIRLGDRVKALLANIGSTGRQYPPLDTAPNNPEPGDTYLADGTNWDPAGTGNAALVTYLGGSWRVTNEYTNAGGV